MNGPREDWVFFDECFSLTEIQMEGLRAFLSQFSVKEKRAIVPSEDQYLPPPNDWIISIVAKKKVQ